jgi:hypothetical protein
MVSFAASQVKARRLELNSAQDELDKQIKGSILAEKEFDVEKEKVKAKKKASREQKVRVLVDLP